MAAKPSPSPPLRVAAHAVLPLCQEHAARQGLPAAPRDPCERGRAAAQLYEERFQSFEVINNYWTTGVRVCQNGERKRCPRMLLNFGSGRSRLHFASFSTTGNDRVGRRVSGIVRGWIFAAALAQAAAPGVIGVIDASAAGEVAAAAIRPHAEDHSTPRCPRVHQEENCALCQFVAGALATTTSQPSPLPPPARHLHVVRRLPLCPEWLNDGAPSLPRAPPALA